MEKITYIYQGRRLTHKKKLIHSYLEKDSGKDSWYSKKLSQSSIGSIIECTKTDTGVKAPYDYKGKFNDESKITHWIELDWAAKKEYDLLKEMKKVPKSEYENILQRLNLILVNLPRNQRKLFKMKLLLDLKD